MIMVSTNNNMAIGVGPPPRPLIIDTNLIILKQKEIAIEFTIDPKKFENIDTITINGFKYIKVKD